MDFGNKVVMLSVCNGMLSDLWVWYVGKELIWSVKIDVC